MIGLKTLGLIGLIVSLALVSGCERNGRIQTGALLAPTNLTAIGISYHEIRLSWQDNSNNESGFKVYSAQSENSPYFQIGNVSADSTEAVHFDLRPLTTYWYYIEAYNKMGTSESDRTNGTTLSAIEILSQNLGERFGDACIRGQAKNITDKTLAFVTITAWFYDSAGILLDTTSDYGFDIPTQMIWNFEIWAISTPRDNVVRYDMKVTDVGIQ